MSLPVARPSSASANDVSLFLVAVIAAFAIGGALTLLHIPFPSQFDELQHFSFIVALRETPTLFPSYGTYKVLNEDLRDWSDAINYIAHPSFYYLLLAPFGDNVLVLRAINFALAVAGFALCAQAGVSLLRGRMERIAYLVLLFAFSKPVLIAGMINNDNLVLLETGAIFWLLARQKQQHPHSEEFAKQASRKMKNGPTISSFETPLAAAPRNEVYRTIAVAVLLALLGWTKFNAFVGLVAMVGLLQLFAIKRREERLLGASSVTLLAGVAIGAIPTIVNLLQLGAPAYVPVHFLYVEPSARPNLDFMQFASAFFHQIGNKFLLADGVTDMLYPLIIAAMIGVFAFLVRETSRAKDIAVCAWLATLFFAAIHVRYGWSSFRALGTLSDAQSRYYVMIWPGFALAIVMGATQALALCRECFRASPRPALGERSPRAKRAAGEGPIPPLRGGSRRRRGVGSLVSSSCDNPTRPSRRFAPTRSTSPEGR